MSNWVSRDPQLSNPLYRPDHLSDASKAMIMSFIDCLELPGVCLNSIQPYVDNLQNEIRRQLSNVVLSQSPEAIQELITAIVMYYTDAIVREGLAVGLIAATSLSSAATQSTMDTFKLKSGASISVEGGIVGLTTLIYTRLERQDPRMIVHFNTPMTKNDIIGLRALIVDLKVSEVVNDYEFGALSQTLHEYDEYSLRRYWWHHAFYYNPAKADFFKNVRPNTQILRLHLDKNLMYSRQTTPKDVADAIERTKGSDIFTLYSPFNDAIVDVFIVPGNENIGLVSKEISYLDVVILKGLGDCPIKGIERIQDVFPKGYNLFDMVLQEKETETGYVLKLGEKNLQVHESLFPPHHLLIRLLNENGMTVVAKNKHSYTGKLLSIEVKSTEAPSTLRPKGEYWYMVTQGSNIDSILKLPFVDPLRTISNDIFQISTMIGLEASRNYFLYELGLVLDSIGSSGINSRHILLTTDVIYISGKPAGTTIQGNLVRKQGPATTASCGKGAAGFTAAAVNRTRESILATTPSIFTGTLAAIGENAKIIKPTLENVKRLREKAKLANEKKSTNIRDTSGLQAVVRENNNKLRKFLLGDINDTPNEISDMTVIRSLRTTKAENAVITESFAEEAALINPGFTPVIVPKAYNDLVVNSPSTTESSTPNVPFQTTISTTSNIRSVVTQGRFPRRSELASFVSLYSGLHAPRKNDSTTIRNILATFQPVVAEMKVTKRAPQATIDITLHRRTFVEQEETKQKISNYIEGRIIRFKPIETSTRYSMVVRHPIFSLEEINYLISVPMITR